MLAAAKAAFLPEFVNRIDEIVTFQPLTPAQVEEIAGLVVARVADRLRSERGIELAVEPELVTQLARDGFDEQFGARPLHRHVRRTLEKELTRAILAGELPNGAQVTASLGGEGVALRVAEPAPAIA
jgi:ATP-dependent Clp protease ATP-binding subunit ClpC